MTLRTQYKFLSFMAVTPPDYLPREGMHWKAISLTGGILGEVRYYKPWHQWVFYPERGSFYSWEFEDVAGFLHQLMGKEKDKDHDELYKNRTG